MSSAQFLPALRRAHLLTRCVLVWFVLSIGVAIASPLVKPQALVLICSVGGGMKPLPPTDGGGQPRVGHTLDCPLCVGLGAPPPPVASAVHAPMHSAGEVLDGVPVTHVAALRAAPLPARGPPASF